MLIEIKCDKFIEKDKVRDPIKLHKGLNVVLGTSDGKNSIGKSTFLMIIDYIFGGSDYLEKCRDVQKHIQDHTICFCFEFDGNLYYFSRFSKTPNIVNVCDKDYNIIDSWTLDQYFDFLKEKYNMPEKLTVRGSIGKYFRVFGRPTINEDYPLKNVSTDNNEESIRNFIRLYEKYDPIDSLAKKKDSIEKEKLAFKRSSEYKFITATTTKTVYKKNEKRIQELQSQLDQLVKDNIDKNTDLDSFKAQQLLELKVNLSKLKRERTKLHSRKDIVGFNKEKKVFQKNFDQLKKFFPNANIKELQYIESFHIGLENILYNQIKQENDKIEDELTMVENSIIYIQKQIEAFNAEKELTTSFLKQYTTINEELQKLREANSNFEKSKDYEVRLKEAKKELKEVQIQITNEIQTDINKKMDEINDYVYQGHKIGPKLTISDIDSTEFFTPEDDGTGSRYCGLLIFDLASLEALHIPVICHDSILLKQIGDEPLQKLFELYQKSEKQIFVAIDKKESYPLEMQKIIDDNRVLYLYPNGGELFGKAWNKK